MVHLKGFEMAFEGGKGYLRNKYDLIVFAAHYALVQEDFLFVGIGDEFTPDDEKKPGSEILSTGWKAENGVYSLKYRSRDGRLKLLFKGILAGDHFILSAVPLNSNSETVHSLNIKADQYIGATVHGSYAEAFVGGSADALATVLYREVVSKLRPSAPAETVKPKDPPGYPEVPPPSAQGVGPSSLRDPSPNLHAFPNIGGSDLDPLGRGGSGMLFDPFSPANRFRPGDPKLDPLASNLPPGAIPPGAKFDPFGPPMPGGFGPQFGPKSGKRGGFPPPDHFPPPGGSDPFI